MTPSSIFSRASSSPDGMDPAELKEFSLMEQLRCKTKLEEAFLWQRLKHYIAGDEIPAGEESGELQEVLTEDANPQLPQA